MQKNCKYLFCILFCELIFSSISACSIQQLTKFFKGLSTSSNSNTILNEIDNMQMIFYTRSSFNSSSETDTKMYNYALSESKKLIDHLDLQKPFVFYIHGYDEHYSNESVQTIVSAYLQRGADNIVVLDWNYFAVGNYLTVFRRIKEVSKYAAQAIEALVKAGVNVDTLHIIGHSMGAQIAGFLWRHLDFKIPRITALDAANPLFYQFGADHIDVQSGQQVDAIHTDGGIYGVHQRTGSIDFYANSGSRPQPGCSLFGTPLSPEDLCSHWRSWRFYAESIVNEKAFPALECESYQKFHNNECNGNRIIYFGYAMPKNVFQTYYFMTNSESPFGRGIEGLPKHQ